ncbi:hypothetical protein OJ920_11375, partial [Streptococcus anginosus]|nr:hypothetical protein [Streptococcus anginosus]
SGAVNERVNRCQRNWLASMQGSVHRGRPFGLDADDLDFGALSADLRRDASKQSTATDGNEDCHRVLGHLFEQLNADRALARDR